MRIPVYFFLLVTILSCQKIEKLERMSVVSKINLLCLAQAGEKFEFHVHKTLSVLDNSSQSNSLTGAIIYVLENGNPADTVTYNSTTQKYRSDIVAAIGSLYEIRVTHPGLPDITAQTRVPDAVSVSGSGFDQSGRSYDENNGVYYTYFNDLKIRFTCEPGKNTDGVLFSLYEIWRVNPALKLMYTKWTILDPQVQPVSPQDHNQFQPQLFPVYQFPTGGQYPNEFFADIKSGADSKQYTFSSEASKSLIRVNFDSIRHVACSIRAFDKDAYAHLRTIAMMKGSMKNIFEEPVQISGNIVNGYGMFGSCTETIVEIPVLK